MGKKFFKEKTESVKKFVKDPKRVALAGATLGQSEILRSTAKELMPKAPGMPDLPNAPGSDDAANAVDRDEEIQRLLRRKGRNANIFTGATGLNTTETISSRTLLGS